MLIYRQTNRHIFWKIPSDFYNNEESLLQYSHSKKERTSVFSRSKHCDEKKLKKKKTWSRKTLYMEIEKIKSPKQMNEMRK